MKFNLKYLNIAAWMTLIMTFVFPYQTQSNDKFMTEFGYPLAYLKVYNKPVGKTLVMSSCTNIGMLLVDVLVIYLIIYWGERLYSLYKNKYKD